MCILDGNKYNARCREVGEQRLEILKECEVLHNQKREPLLHSAAAKNDFHHPQARAARSSVQGQSDTLLGDRVLRRAALAITAQQDHWNCTRPQPALAFPANPVARDVRDQSIGERWVAVLCIGLFDSKSSCR